MLVLKLDKDGCCCVVCLVTQSCLTLYKPLDYSPPSSSVYEIFQARILEWVATSYSRGSSQPKDQNYVSCVFRIAGRFFTFLSHQGSPQRQEIHTKKLQYNPFTKNICNYKKYLKKCFICRYGYIYIIIYPHQVEFPPHFQKYIISKYIPKYPSSYKW